MSVKEITMRENIDALLLDRLPAELADRIYSQALHETTLPDDVMHIITTYNQYTNRLTNLVDTYHRLRQIASSIAKSVISAVQVRYDNFARPSPSTSTGSVNEITPDQWIRSGALALVSLRELLPYTSRDCRSHLARLVQHNFKHGLMRKTTADDERTILNAKMLILAGYEDCLVLFDDKGKTCLHLEQYHQEIQGNLRPDEKRLKVDDYRGMIKPRSEAKRHQLEEVVSRVQNWLVPGADEAEILNNDARYNEIDVEGEVLREISQDLGSDSIPELAYFVTRLAVIITDCYKRETRGGVGKLGKHDSGSEARSI